MTRIDKIYGSNGLNMVRPDQRINGTTPTPAGAKPQDQVEFSEAGQQLSNLQQPEMRMDKVERVRQAIAQGTYETPDKINVVVDRLLKEVTAD